MTSDGSPADITPAAPPPRVVVGYDGSAGRAMLERAVDAAGDAGFVFVVHAYAPPRDGWGHPKSMYQERLDTARDDAEATIRELREQTGGPLDRVAWAPEIIGGNPPKAIAAVAAARHADEIVVGSRSFSLARGARQRRARPDPPRPRPRHRDPARHRDTSRGRSRVEVHP